MRAIYFLFLAFSIVSCGNKTDVRKDPVVVIGDSLSALYGKTLVGNLSKALNEGGTVHAIDFCYVSVDSLTKQISGNGISISRTSLNVRNTSNKPDAIDIAVLQRIGQQEEWNLPAHVTMWEESGVHRYYKPIRMQTMCLQCHGNKEDIDEEVLQSLKEKYPQDKAFGYEEGDLRGVFKFVIVDSVITKM